MLYGFILVIHVLVCLFLIAVILLQGGRGGMSETLGGSAAQSLFGGGVATVLTRVTTACASLFVITCLSLAYLSTMQGRSVIEQAPFGLPPEGSLPFGPAETAQPSAASRAPAAEPKPAAAQPAAGQPAAQQPAAPPQAPAASPSESTPSP